MAEGWLVLTLTDSPFWVGAVAGVRGISILCLSPLAGVVADRVSRKKLLLATYVLSAFVAFALAFLSLTGHIRLWQIFVLSFLQSTSLTFGLPTRLTLAMDLVGKRAILNANTANYMGYGMLQIFVPSIGGFVISKGSIGILYLLVGAGYASAALLVMKVQGARMVEIGKDSLLQNMRDGAAYVSKSSVLMALLLVLIIVNTFGWSYNVMLPVMARDVLKVGATGFGYLSTASGLGFFAGTILVSAPGGLRSSGRMLMFGCAGFGISLVLFALSPWFFLSMFLLIAVIATAVAFDSVMVSQLQVLSSDNMRGRVMSFYSQTTGMILFGGFPLGAIASLWGAPVALALNGGVLLLNALLIVRLLPRIQQKESSTA